MIHYIKYWNRIIKQFNSTYLSCVTIVFLLLLISIPGFSQNTLDRYLKEAAENNPEIKAKFQDYLAVMEKIPQARALPDPQVTFGAFISPVETRVGPQRAKVSISQMFPWFGTLEMAGEVAAAEAKTKYRALQHAKQRLYFDVREQWYQLVKLERDIALHEENLQLLKSIKSIALRQYEAGNVGMADVVRAQLKINEAESKLEGVQDKRKPAFTRFNTLLNRDPQATLTIPDSMVLQELPEKAVMDSILVNNTQLETLRAAKKAAMKKEKLAGLKGYPSFGVGLDYVNVGARTDMELIDNGQDVIMPMVSVSIPLYRKKYTAMKREASIKINAIEAREESVSNNLIAGYENKLWQYDDARRQVRLYNTQVEEATNALQIIRSGYVSGEEDFQDLLQIQQQILNYQLSLIKAKMDQNVAVANIRLLMSQNINTP